MDQAQYDLNRICRTCKNESSEMRSVFEGCEMLNESPRIDEMLMACTSVQVKAEDGLPNLICVSCTERLKSAYVFKQQCQQSDVCLREYARSLKVDEIKQELQNADGTLSESLVEALAQDPQRERSDSSLRSDFIEFMENNQMILTCRECGKVFTTLEGLRSHKRIHLGTLFKCRFCGKGYTRQTHVYRHELSHGKHKLHVCRICNKTLTRMEHLKRHLTTHLKEKPFSCKSCNRGFNRSDHLDVHAVRCKGERVHICDICNRGFSREDSLEVHKRLHENQKPALPTLDNIDNIEEHYYEIDFDPNLDYSAASDVDDYLEPHVEVTENLDEDKIKEVADLQNEDSSSKAPESDEQLDIKEMLESQVGLGEANNTEITIEEDTKLINREYVDEVYEEADDVANDVADNDSDSAHSEYLPTKVSPPKRRTRGRPRKHHSSKSTGRPRGRPAGVKKERRERLENEEEGEFSCASCSEVFPKTSQLEKHMKSHECMKVHTCRVCNKQFPRLNHLKRHMTSHSIIRPFACDLCPKKFSRRDHLQQHTRLHDKKQEYECDVCKKAFNRADQLAKHKVSKHNIGEKVLGEKKFECHVCLKNFTTEKYRDVHVKGHLGEKRFQCKTCDKCFLSKSHLTEHMKFHNEHSKKFLCSECGQRFIRNDYLVIHMRRHRGEKPFKCKYCGKGFPRTTDLTVHERYHTGEKTHLCTICGRGFGRAYNLTVHMRTHTGEKPYRCTYCDAAFAQGNDLKAHVRRHTGERFQCELCTESFLMGYLLTQHKRTVHGLNVVSNIRRLQPANKIKQDTDDPPPITIPLPKPVVPDLVLNNLQAHLVAQIQHHQLARE
ncbi:zinc finger and SCAN domain-containing protein 2-like [Asbolus verrucosus]|uniref:Zinc finger and SCAN domain-containing protein 2-like n=1 Tax=Asbolus verrucosus TaxID=1661398 RepID=A0A482VPR6_ASBVE|nr:zinc finger and SCAN domain-containing protein 2-like [Asbolus verrucosus]